MQLQVATSNVLQEITLAFYIIKFSKIIKKKKLKIDKKIPILFINKKKNSYKFF